MRGRPLEAKAYDEIRELLGDAAPARNELVECLHKIQDRWGGLDKKHLRALAEHMKLSQTDVYETATFYHHFDVHDNQPPPPVTVRVCESLTCEMFGARELLQVLQEKAPESVRVQTVPCVGRCAEAPVAVIGQRPLPHAEPDETLRMADARLTTADMPASAIGYDAYRADGGYQLLIDCHNGKRSADECVQIMSDSQLRGLGGAGFPVGRKWSILQQQPAPKYVAINIDEGEPGTFKDRYFLERDPHRFIEGTLLSAWVIGGVEQVYIYLRDEYAGCRALLERELAALTADPPCPLPPITLRRGAGAYICGEESAMIESIEGKRGMPRHRPPYIASEGLFGRPTLEQNMETMHWVRDILVNGAESFNQHGRRDRCGLHSFSVSGRVQKPGVHIAPAGISVRELIDEYCGGMLPGHKLYGYFPGGASGGILPAALADVPLDFDTLQEYGCFIGSAAVIILSDHDSARASALNAMRFFEYESCGQCTPCRVGTAKASRLMERADWDQPLLHELAQVMTDASICGLGQAASNPMLCAMRYFPDEFQKNTESGHDR